MRWSYVLRTVLACGKHATSSFCPPTHRPQPPQQRSSPQDNLWWSESRFLMSLDSRTCIISASGALVQAKTSLLALPPTAASWAWGLGLQRVWNYIQITEARRASPRIGRTQFAKGKAKLWVWANDPTASSRGDSTVPDGVQLHLRIEVRCKLSTPGTGEEGVL